MIRTLITDDHEMFRYGLGRLLADVTAIDVVGHAGSGEESVELCRELVPDVVLMDLVMRESAAWRPRAASCAWTRTSAS